MSEPIPESPPHPPTVPSATLTGLATGKPRLKFTLAAGSNAAPIQSVTITVPSGLSFSHGRKQLARGVSGLAGTGVDKYTLAATGNRLKVALSGSVKRIPLTIGAPALKDSKALIKKRPRKLDILLRVVDGMGRTSALHMTIVVR